MRAGVLLVLVVLELGCVKGPAGPPGPEGAKGDPGPGRHQVWVDATGAEVSAVAGDAPEYFDSRGFIWRLSPGTAQVQVNLGAVVLFKDSACTGARFAALIGEPRVVTQITGSNPPVYVVRPDSDEGAETVVASSLFYVGAGGSCMPNAGVSGNNSIVPIERVTPQPPLTLPAVPFAGPLHREQR